MSDVLVVKINAYLKPKELNDFRRWIEAQKATGTVVLPPYCEALVIPEDVEIRVEDFAGNEVKGEQR